MPRPARFSSEQILGATAFVVAQQGPAGASIARIAGKLGAPTGSIYHRFASRSVLLGEIWLQTAGAFQNDFFARLDGPDPKAAGLAAVQYIPQWVREHPQESRILLLYRRSDFLESEWPEPMAARARALQARLSRSLRRFCKGLLGRADATSLRILTFALAEAPLAAVKHHIEADEPPPPIVDALIEETYRASLSLIGVAL